MEIFRHFNALPARARNAAVAIGNFDGVHLGHQAVIGEAGRIARAGGFPWAVLTFEPHPTSLFRPNAEPFRLTPFRAKTRQIAALGVDVLIVLRFDRNFASLEADDFVNRVLVEGLKAHHVVAGYDFAFGKGRRGDVAMLVEKGRMLGFGFTSLSAVGDDGGEVFSATRARQCLKSGDPKGAAAILGRPFEIEGKVLSGDQRGRTIGYPTANLKLRDSLRPSAGVYAVRVGIEGREGMDWRAGVANIGKRPTFGGEDLVLEAHLFDFAGDLYGRTLRVALIDFLRPEKKFDGIEALKAQIAQDSDRARQILA
jgi:riboflavin kinase/FMN adenylyltransferase